MFYRVRSYSPPQIRCRASNHEIKHMCMLVRAEDHGKTYVGAHGVT